MTDQKPQTTSLSPDEWKVLCLQNAAQLHAFLTGIPPMTETGTAGITDEHLALIDGHVARGRAFLNAWQRSRAAGSVAQAAAQPQPQQAAPVSEQQTNGEEKRKGGWPKGKSRQRKAADDGAVTQ